MRLLAIRCVAPLVAAAALTSPAVAAVRFDAAASVAGRGSASLDVTVGSGANRFAVVAVATPASARVSTTPTFGGVAMFPVTAAQGAGCFIDVYGVLAPASGTRTARVTISSSSAAFVLAAAAYDGVDQLLPTDDSSAQASGSGSAASGNAYFTPGVDEIGFGALCATGSMIAATAADSSRWNRATGNLLGAGSDSPAGLLRWQLGAAGAIGWAVASCPLRAAPGSPPVPADASAPTTADAAPVPRDAAPAPDASAPPRDAAVPPPPDSAPAALDAGDSPAPDALERPLDGNVVAVPRQRPPDDGADASAPREIDLVVSTGCRTAGRGAAGSALPLYALALLIVVARRWR
jgi:hypothetical protein